MKHGINFFIALSLLLLMTVSSITVTAQCAMCKAATESNMKENQQNNIGKGLNFGILYLMAIPYLMGGVAGVVWYVRKKKFTTEPVS